MRFWPLLVVSLLLVVGCSGTDTEPATEVTATSTVPASSIEIVTTAPAFTTASTRPTATTNSATTTTNTTVVTDPTLAPVTDLAGGLFCRDLVALSHGYAAAVAYWQREGEPDRMDADLNGIPCETVYDPAEVDAYWGDLRARPVLVGWTSSATAWPDLRPGCCGGRDIVPLSPTDPWPATGWPADGFYPVWPSEAAWDVPDDPGDRPPVPAAVTFYDLTIGRWVDAEGSVPGDGTASTMTRTLPFSEDLTVVIKPMVRENASQDALVGDGVAFRDLLADLNSSYLTWLADQDRLSAEELAALRADPDYPIFDPPGVYRGPEGSLISPGTRWWFALEIRAGEPILYLHAAFIAG